MVYFVALAAIVAITMFGLGGISARFGANTQPPAPASVQGTQSSQQASADIAPAPGTPGLAPAVDLGQVIATAVLPDNSASANPPVPTPTPMPPLPAPAAQPTLPAPSGEVATDPAPVAPQVYTPLEAQGGTITGEASTPFHVVQSGDTLSQIAQQLGVDVNALVSVNNLVDDLIYPGQVLYLPLPEGGQAQPTAEAQPEPPQQPMEPPADQGEQSGAGGAPAPVGTSVPQVPEMPNTGINKKR